jgi:hypothetical protein
MNSFTPLSIRHNRGVQSTLEIGAIVWGVWDIDQAVRFWSEALNYKLRREPDVDWAVLVPNDGEGVQLSLNKSPSDKLKRHHLDLLPHHRAGEVDGCWA